MKPKFKVGERIEIIESCTKHYVGLKGTITSVRIGCNNEPVYSTDLDKGWHIQVSESNCKSA